MSPELDAKLCADFPLLYRKRDESPTTTCMAWGFPGDGWFGLIRDLSEKLEAIIKRLPEDPDNGRPCAEQVKEKFGRLRFYMSYTTDEMRPLIADAEALSGKTCEECGKPGSVQGPGYFQSLCPDCRQQPHATNSSR